MKRINSMRMRVGLLGVAALAIFCIVVNNIVVNNAIQQDTVNEHQSFREATEFRIYADKGEFYEFEPAAYLEDRLMNSGENYTSFQKGEISFLIVDGKGVFSAELGTTHVEMFKSRYSITFIEITGGGSHVMTIWNKWDKKKGGYEFIYTRNVDVLGGKGVMSIFRGVAKPNNR